MVREHQRRRHPLVRAGAAVFAALLALDATPVGAQRRRAEPEANPDFQSQVQSAPQGGPLQAEGGETSIESTAPSPELAPAAAPGETPRGVQTVQIGAAAPSRPAAAASPAPLDTRVTVRVKGAPLATFLDTIAAQARVNFIITDGLEQKKITAFLQNVTVREALQVLLEIKGLTYQQIGRSNTYVVSPRSKQAETRLTRIYPLSYVALIPLTSEALGESSSSSSSSGGSAAAATSSGSPDAGKPCGQRNQKIPIVRVLCSVLSKTGDIEVEPRTNSIIVTDVPEAFPQVEQIIAELDKKAPQVMIEAQIVEINSNKASDLGFEWGGANGELATFTGGARDTTFPLNLPSRLSNTHFFDPLNPTNGIISTLGNSGALSSSDATSASNPSLSSTGFLKTSVLDLTQLQITLRALVSRSEARFLGKPKILTLNNKTATIEITADQAVGFQSSITGAQGVAQTVSQAERHETGVLLKVTPQVNKEGDITMLIAPSFTSVQQSAISRPAVPIFDPVKRSAKTLVRVKNGQTLVLGGLLQSTENKVVRKVPLLGYIPIIGWLFTSVQSSRQNTDLVIFLTPTIVSD
ncbi:MAG: hypothetical protein HY552_04145 [Elusimicrobia bacterium]|nr:hypothetical protein [Elusimicrobiota bacterium]